MLTIPQDDTYAEKRGEKRVRTVSPPGEMTTEGTASSKTRDDGVVTYTDPNIESRRRPPPSTQEERLNATSTPKYTAEVSSDVVQNSNSADVDPRETIPEAEGEFNIQSRSKLIALTGRWGLTGVKGILPELHAGDNRVGGLVIDVTEVPEAVCVLALQFLQSIERPNFSMAWSRDTCLGQYSAGRRSKYHQTYQSLAACQTCTNTGRLCVGIDKDEHGKFSLRIRPLAAPFRGDATFDLVEGWIRRPKQGEMRLTRHKDWRS